MSLILYIGNRKVDLSDNSPVLITYQDSDLTDPVAVKNAYSQQLTLPGSPANDAIFGAMWRSDRKTHDGGTPSEVGVYYNALRRTPFVLYNERSEIVQSGYVKLDSVTSKGDWHEYAITLYGGLGSLIYSLTTDANGDTRTLADMDYMSAGVVQDLSFVINRSTVQTAWGSDAGKWAIINFAPAYNGIAENFDAKKILVKTTAVNSAGKRLYPDTVGDDHVAPYNNWGVVELPEEIGEWQVGDLRSYLQRPVISLSAILGAVANPSNNGGWTIDYQASLPSQQLWMTLPRICTILDESSKTNTAIGTFGEAYNPQTSYVKQDWTRETPTFTPRSERYLHVSTNWTITPFVYIDDGQYDDQQFTEGVAKTWDAALYKQCTYYQVQALDADNNVVGYSDIYALAHQSKGTYTPVGVATSLYPTVPAGYLYGDTIQAQEGLYDIADDNHYHFLTAGNLTGTIECDNATHIRIVTYVAPDNPGYGPVGLPARVQYQVDGNVGFSARFNIKMTFNGARTGATISKQMLLGSTKTPADYLLSVCKMFGWRIVADAATKTAVVYDRKRYWPTSEIESLDSRIDRSSISVHPVYAGARLYEMSSEQWGASSSRYEQETGRVYGSMRIDTGYQFDEAEPQSIMDKVVFAGSATTLETGALYSRPSAKDTRDWRPSFAQLGYKLVYGTKDKQGETDITPYNPYYRLSYNPTHIESDWMPKVCLCDKDGKPEDGTGVLLYRDKGAMAQAEGVDLYLSDDTPTMQYLVGGSCYIQGEPSYQILPEIVPVYRRYIPGPTDTLLDWGTPAINYWPEAPTSPTNIYQSYWRAYLSDRYDKDSRVLKCKAYLHGLGSPQSIMRRFWAYDGAIWIINKIINHNPDRVGLTEVEMLKVQDKSNYR